MPTPPTLGAHPSYPRNPYFTLLKTKKEAFVKHVAYYNLPDPSQFLAAYEGLCEKTHTKEAALAFMKTVATVLLPVTYNGNGYLQEDIVDMYTIAEEMVRLDSTVDQTNAETSQLAMGMFERLILFRARLEPTLQRGDIRFGFIKIPKFGKGLFQPWGPVKYVIGKLYPSRTRRSGCCSIPKTVEASKKASSGCKPIITDTEECAAQMSDLSDRITTPALRREVLELDSLFAATHESYVSSFIILFAFISLVTGIVFTIGNLLDLGGLPTGHGGYDLVRAATWSFGLLTPVTAFFAYWWLGKKVWVLFRLSLRLGFKSSENKSKSLVRRVAHWQIFITALWSLASGLATVALPWSLAASEGWWPHGQNVPGYLALASISLTVVVLILLFILEYTILYSLPCELGEYVCNGFEGDLRHLEMEFAVPKNETQSKRAYDTALWEYVARAFALKYRFDVVFAADRFGSIFHYIQSGVTK